MNGQLNLSGSGSYVQPAFSPIRFGRSLAFLVGVILPILCTGSVFAANLVSSGLNNGGGQASSADYTVQASLGDMTSAGQSTGGVYTNTGGGTSVQAPLEALPPTPVITTVQGSQTVTAGQAVTFSVNATGTVPLIYQWYTNGAAISGATGSSYTIPDATSGNAANYTVIVTDNYSDINSSTYTLTVNTGIPTMHHGALFAQALLLFFVAIPFLREKQTALR